MSIPKPLNPPKADYTKAKLLLANAPLVQDACDLDLLVFLYRHPRTLLTSEQLAAFVGYDMRRVVKVLDAFAEAGILERVQSSTHAARMYLLSLHGPHGGGIKPLLEVASTREGRRSILEALNAGNSRTRPRSSPRLKLVQSA